MEQGADAESFQGELGHVREHQYRRSGKRDSHLYDSLVEGSTRGECISSESKRIRIEDIHFTGHKSPRKAVIPNNGFDNDKDSYLIRALGLLARCRILQSFISHRLLLLARPKSNNTALRNASR